MGKHLITVFLFVILESILPNCIAETNDYQAQARAFARKQLQNPNTFSPFPPSDLNPYKQMSQEQIRTIQMNAFNNGSILQFYLNGVPSLFTSNVNHKKHGLEKAWYENGRVKYEEQYDQEQLVDGVYFDESGSTLSQIKNGTGVKIIFARPNEMKGQMLGSAEYKDRLKHGTEIIYRDYAKKIKSTERNYREGKLHGVETEWMSTGQKNNENHYRNGVKHGKCTNWYKNGKPGYIFEYKDGKPVGTSTRYYETGIMSQESSSNEVKKWFPSGQLMVHTVKGDDYNIISAKSFDRLGNENGKVVNEVGTLIEADVANSNSRVPLIHSLRIYGPKPSIRPIYLPTAKKALMNYSDESSDINLSIKFSLGANTKWQAGTVTILLPDGASTDDNLQFTVDGSSTERQVELGSVKITLPQPYGKWTGSILADIDGTVKGHKVRYQQVILKHTVEEPIKPNPRPKRLRKPVARKSSVRDLSSLKQLPHNSGKLIPIDSKAVDHWTMLMPDRQRKEWALYDSPAVLLARYDQKQDWQVVRKDFNYRPCGMIVRANDFMLIWGTEATEDVSKTIPYHVEKSMDGGKTWSSVKIPKVDYLLDLSGENEVILISGIRIPDDGIPPDKDWFELKPTMILSKDGTTFVEQAGSSFFDFSREKTVVKSIAPNGIYKAMILSSRGMDATSYSLDLSKAQDQIPKRIMSLPENSEIVWSADSQILAVKKDDKFIAYYDIKTDRVEELPFSSNRQPEKNNKKHSEFDRKVNALLKLDK